MRDAFPGVTVTGLDVSPDMVRAARENAVRLGLGASFAAHVLDVRETRRRAAASPSPEAFLPQPESFDYALCNPPYRPEAAGRTSPRPGRRLARSESCGALADFLDAAAFFLVNRGTLALVYPASRLSGLFAALAEKKLEPKTVLPVLSRPDRPARLTLVSAVKNGGREMSLLPPLLLFRASAACEDTTDAPPRRLSDQALAFCPCLSANP
jgi:tRNA1Val (adenine37-N6)-methyltransferase